MPCGRDLRFSGTALPVGFSKNFLPPNMSDAFFALTPRLRVAVLAALAACFGAGCDAKKSAAIAPPVVDAPSEKTAVDAPVASRAEVVQEIANETPPLSAGAAQKLDAALVRALKKGRSGASPEAGPLLDPAIPVQDGERVLVELKATVSKELLEQVALAGGQVLGSSEADHSLRAMIPFAQLEALAGRADVQSISPGTLTVTSQAQTPPAAPAKAGP